MPAWSARMPVTRLPAFFAASMPPKTSMNWAMAFRNGCFSKSTRSGLTTMGR